MSKIGYARVREKQAKITIKSIRLQLGALIMMLVTALLVGNIYRLPGLLLGGICSIIPNLYFAYYSFRYSGARNKRKVIASVYVAEAIKFIMIFCMLVTSYSLTLRYETLSAVDVLMGFLITYLSLLALPLVAK